MIKIKSWKVLSASTPSDPNQDLIQFETENEGHKFLINLIRISKFDAVFQVNYLEEDHEFL